MNKILFFIFFMTTNASIVIFDFNSDCDISQWYETNDNVMGGISTSRMKLDKNGNGVFSGNVSTANNGGFAMTRLPLKINLSNDSKKIILRALGDNKKYQFRIKSSYSQRYWYVQSFQTSNEMKDIELPLKDFYPSFRGYKLNQENFSSSSINEIAILVGNKKNEDFKLVIDKITIK
jgi:hypothetical protein